MPLNFIRMFHIFNFCVFTIIFMLSARVCVMGKFCTNTLHHAVFTKFFFLYLFRRGHLRLASSLCVSWNSAVTPRCVTLCREQLGWSELRQTTRHPTWLTVLKVQDVDKISPSFGFGLNKRCGSEDQKSINYKLKWLHFGFRAVWLIEYQSWCHLLQKIL